MRVKHILIFLLMSISANADADEYYNGWTEATSKALIQGCLDDGVKKQMQQIYKSGRLNKYSTQKEIDITHDFIEKAMSFICTCNQKQFMKDYNFKDADKILSNIIYTHQVVKKCSEDWRNKQM